MYMFFFDVMKKKKKEKRKKKKDKIFLIIISMQDFIFMCVMDRVKYIVIIQKVELFWLELISDLLVLEPSD